MSPLFEDSKFYGVAATIAEVCQALSRNSSPAAANSTMKSIMDFSQKQNSQAEDTMLGPIQPEVETPVIQEHSNSSFVYQPLEGPSAIRILVLYPGSPCDPLRGKIQHVAIKETSYEAISYTWGGDSKPCSILLDGCQMPLTQSLFNALGRLRYLNKNRKLWADGLCINQADNKEKGIQVALMPQIYTYARRVLVHLGEEAADSKLIPEFLERLLRVDFDDIKNQRMLPEQYVANGLPPADSKTWKALVALLCRPWFLRVWIIQEVILARDIQFFCGDWELGWGLFASLADTFDRACIENTYINLTYKYTDAQHAAMSLALMLSIRLSRSVVAERLEILRRDIESIPDTGSARRHIESLSQDLIAKRELIIQSCREHRDLYPMLERAIYPFDSLKPSSSPILKLLGLFHRNEATKPQDRLYALTGLAEDINLEDFPPDYEENLGQTNARFARILVEKGQGMDLLYHATKLPSRLLDPRLPSWAPDWTSQRTMGSHWLKLGWAYNQYSGGFDGRVDSSSYVSLLSPDLNFVRVFGFRIDHLESVVKLHDDPFEFKVSNFTEASKKFFHKSERLTNGYLYFTGEPWPKVLCRTLVADHLRKQDISITDELEQYEEARRLFADSSHNLQRKSSSSWGSAWLNLMPEYSFCKTTSGYVGLVPMATITGDEIRMFRGSDLPFVIRQIGPSPGCYRFIGGCYIHGLMRGEAWNLEHTLLEILLL